MTAPPQASSIGQGFMSSRFLDRHFESCKEEYEAQLRSVGIEPGWHVLDAGSGTGGYIPWIADLVGETGQVTALELAPENVALIQGTIEQWELPCIANATTGSVLEIPFDDDSFDAVWCANAIVYVYDHNRRWEAALAELRRVVRPGGLIAIKDVDTSLYRIRPTDPTLLPNFYRAGTRLPDNATAIAALNGTWNLQRDLERAGLTSVWQRTTLIERRSPLSDADRAYLSQLLGSFSTIMMTERESKTLEDIARWFGIQESEMADSLAFWEAIGRFDDPDHIFNHPDFYWSEGQVLAVGRVPQQREAAQ